MVCNQAIVDAAEARLDASPHLLRRSVTCRFDQGVLRLDGRVPSFYLKQKAQTLVNEIDGVNRVENALVVINSWGLSSESHEELALAR